MKPLSPSLVSLVRFAQAKPDALPKPKQSLLSRLSCVKIRPDAPLVLARLSLVRSRPALADPSPPCYRYISFFVYAHLSFFS
ncbi:hypothetical protein IEQ34_004812 [Dendrobium chrysotoxum]|uniref:Uncharacterized protein n=1 Tax=Dendrobium chrysotoxum TaxID=161865 RepID=A0AAV7H9A8_DENCH|nr:hypothetical protein IEQ34_004812 [Dendrobium chrysotoxum]